MALFWLLLLLLLLLLRRRPRYSYVSFLLVAFALLPLQRVLGNGQSGTRCDRLR